MPRPMGVADESQREEAFIADESIVAEALDDDDDDVSERPIGSDDDLLFEYNVLKKRIIEEASVAKQHKDKVYFLLVKLKAKDEQLLGLRENLRRRSKELSDCQDEVTALGEKCDQLNKKLALMKTHQMQLEYEKYQLQNTQSERTGSGGGETSEEAHSRGVEKAKMLLAHQLFKQQADRRIDVLQKSNKQMRRTMERRLQQLEGTCMEYEDEYAADTLHSLMNTLKQGRYQQYKEARTNLGRDLRFNERIQIKAPDDSHVLALLERSSYAPLLTQCREEIGDSAKELKQLGDRTMQTLWLLFNEKSSQLAGGGARPTQRPFRKIFEEFYKTVEQTLIRSKQTIAEFSRKINGFTKAMLSREREVAEQIRRTRFSTIDAEVQVEVRPDTPKEVYDLRGEVAAYQRRLKELNKETAEKEHRMELRASKAESNLEYIQRHILKLHRSLFTTLHLVYKHRYRWTTRLPDPMRTLRIPEAKEREKALEVGFNMKLGDLLQADRVYMETFGNYMVSDEFGANAVVDQGAQTRSMRRKSFGGFSVLERAEPPRHEDPHGGTIAKLPKAPLVSKDPLGGPRLRRISDVGADTVSSHGDDDHDEESRAGGSACPVRPSRRAGSSSTLGQQQQQPSQLSSLPSFAQPIGRLKARSVVDKPCYFTTLPTDDDPSATQVQPTFMMSQMRKRADGMKH